MHEWFKLLLLHYIREFVHVKAVSSIQLFEKQAGVLLGVKTLRP